MNTKLFLTVFATVFFAELGDKTQIATILFAGNKDVNKLTVFIGASLALILTSAIGVLVGSTLSDFVNGKYLSYIAGVGFILVGIWTIFKA